MHDLSADEPAVRDLLDLVATDQAPPSRIDLDLARRRGRRLRRLRRVYLPAAAPVAAAAAVTLIAALTAGLSGSHAPAKHPASGHRRTAPIASPHRFSLLRPYASFGWLPAGFQLGDQYDQSTAETDVTASAPLSDGRALMLVVDAADQCRLAGPESLTYLQVRYRFPHTLSCGQPLTGRAPDVNGRTAYWSLHGSLVWEYGVNAWAILTPMANGAICVHCAAYPRLNGWSYVLPKNGHPAVRQSAVARRLLVKIASAVRLGIRPAVYYGFTLGGLPASWEPFRGDSLSSFTVIDGKLVNEGWSAGPAVDPTALGVSVWPASTSAYSCKVYPGQTSYVTVDGTSMLLRTIDQPGKHVQYLCARNFRGLEVLISLDLKVPGTDDRRLPGAAQVGGVSAVLRHLQLFGPDVADWPAQQP